MRTPAGKECRFYYEDFNRGRNRQECRLILHGSGKTRWRPEDCEKCNVPEILWANASEHLELHAQIKPGLLGFGRHVEISASCRKHLIALEDPYTGCPDCANERPGLSSLLGENKS